jgi:hypothetical protein
MSSKTRRQARPRPGNTPAWWGTERLGERGQATADYALVRLAAAALAGLLLAWAVGTDGIERLLDAVLDRLIGQAG